MPTSKAREDVKTDLNALKEDLKSVGREESARLRARAAEAEAALREKADVAREKARVYYDEARVRGREYYDEAAERLDEAQRYLVERVQERPMQSTAIALGVGVVIGLLLAGRRHLMVGKRLVKRLAAALAVAGCAFVVIVCLGATVFYALQLLVSPLAAAALTALIFAALAGIIGAVFLGKAGGYDEPEEDDEPLGLGARAVQLFRQRPILGVAAALAGGFIFLRNPALATMVAAAFTEQSRPRRRR